MRHLLADFGRKTSSGGTKAGAAANRAIRNAIANHRSCLSRLAITGVPFADFFALQCAYLVSSERSNNARFIFERLESRDGLIAGMGVF